MRTKRTLLVVLSLGLLLSACGTSTTERGLSGAGIGAGLGAATAALTEADLLGASLIGAAVGAAAGALTSQETIDLGQPVWQ